MKMEEIKEEVKRRIFTKSMMRNAFTEEELKRLTENENFYESDGLWFSKTSLEQQIPRLIKIFRDNPELLKVRKR
tara:strand:- start:8958 stop:9182 length:225 start_codon:yes stop_codon:yes gene_type:complete